MRTVSEPTFKVTELPYGDEPSVSYDNIAGGIFLGECTVHRKTMVFRVGWWDFLTKTERAFKNNDLHWGRVATNYEEEFKCCIVLACDYKLQMLAQIDACHFRLCLFLPCRFWKSLGGWEILHQGGGSHHDGQTMIDTSALRMPSFQLFINFCSRCFRG